MVILHFSCIEDIKTSGVCIAVLQHVAAQGRFADTALINVNGIGISGCARQLPYSRDFDVGRLPEPFNRPDIAVFHECYRPQYLRIARNLEKHGVPYVIIPHGELRKEAQGKKRLKKTLANLLLFNRFIDRAAALQCLSENELRATRFGKNKFIGTNGVDLPEQTKTSFRSEGAVFIFIGRYEWQVKGLDLLFDAIKSEESFLRDKRCRFILHGPDILGRLAAVSEMVREREIGDLVSLNLAILGDEKRKALLDADIFIQTSRHEGMPIGILEAMGYGLPCLVTEGTSLGGVVAAEGAGWVAQTTAQDIAACIVEAVKDRARWSEFGKNGRNAVLKSFSWDVIAEDTVNRYGELLNDHAG